MRALLPRVRGRGRELSPHRVLMPDRATGLPSGDDEIDTSEMFAYQVAGARFLRSHPRALLADEMGVGKSVQVLRALERRTRAVIVCPASVCLQWEKERDRWRSDLSIDVGCDLRRPREGELVVLSCDSLPEPSRSGRLLVGESMRGVRLILDEVSMLKSDGAERTQRIRLLTPMVESVWGLDGTPMPNIPTDLWGVLETMGLEHVFGSKAGFLALTGAREVRGRGRAPAYEWGEVSPEVRRLLGTVMLRRTRAEVLPHLPERQYQELFVPAPESLRTDGDPARARRELAVSRIPAALDWARACPVPLLVWSVHREPVLAMQQLARAGALTGTTSDRDRRRLVDRFQSGALRVLAITLDTGAAGLNLTAAGAELFIDRSFVPGRNEQAEARPLRTGQKHRSVLVVRMMCADPLDRRREESVIEKTRLIRACVG